MAQKTIDIHCHVSLKPWLFPAHHIYDEVSPKGLGDFSERLFYNLDNIKQGNVGVVVAAHYLPESELLTEFNDKFVTTLAATALKILCKRKLERVIEDKTSSPTASFDQIIKYIKDFEEDVKVADTEFTAYNVAVAHSHSELQSLLAAGNIVFLHSIEGAHVLGNNGISYENLENNLTSLFNLGICQITIGHFFQNILFSSSGGIPPSVATKVNYVALANNTHPNGYNGTMAIKMVDKMLELGILIDLVHAHPGAKAMVYERNNMRGENKRPLLFSHTGCQAVVKKHDAKRGNTMPQVDMDYITSDEDIMAIKDCNGLLGIIFMKYWLTGDDDHGDSIDAIVETIMHIRDVPDSSGAFGTYDNIAIGTDLDGYTTTPQDLLGPSQMPKLVDAISNIPGITSQDVDNICYGNYMRVLKAGWGKVN